MILDLTSLRSAIAQCHEALFYCRSDLAKQDAKLAQHLRAGAIQAFEFTYELSVKMLKRYLEATEATPIDEMSFNELVRRGYETGLLNAEIEQWKAFRKNRGSTSHAYDMAKAMAVFQSIPEFLTEAEFLLAEIEKRQERQV
jgi:nucleotidyltransferase substrate binding protein (TIGR01987 family)